MRASPFMERSFYRDFTVSFCLFSLARWQCHVDFVKFYEFYSRYEHLLILVLQKQTHPNVSVPPTIHNLKRHTAGLFSVFNQTNFCSNNSNNVAFCFRNRCWKYLEEKKNLSLILPIPPMDNGNFFIARYVPNKNIHNMIVWCTIFRWTMNCKCESSRRLVSPCHWIHFYVKPSKWYKSWTTNYIQFSNSDNSDIDVPETACHWKMCENCPIKTEIDK